MSVTDVLKKLTSVIPPQRVLELYPPFLFMGVKVKSVSADYRRMRIRLPMKWYGKNQYGSIFGGLICSVSDPLPALLCSKLFPAHEIWTAKNCVEFLKPAKGAIEAEVVVTEHDIKEIERALADAGKTRHEFEFEFRDRKGTLIARVKNTVFIRRGGKPFH